MLGNIKSVLIGITEEGEDSAASALAYGLSLARQARAHATIQAASLKVVLGSTFVSDTAAGIIAGHNRRLQDLTAAIANRARGDADAQGVNATVETMQLPYGELVETFLAQARVHDVCVLDAAATMVDTDRGLIEAMLFESGRPVIVVPPGCDAFRHERILVAWDASPRAARAVNDALPILTSALAVEVLAIDTREDLASQVPGAELAPHLARHGVNVTVKNLVVQASGIAGTLREQAALFHADMLVMGAFNHSLMREWVLGGVTQSLLAQSPTPLFMSY